MHPADIDALVVRAKAGDAEGLSILIAGHVGAQVRTLAARYASSRAMVEEAVRETWAAAYREIAGCAPGAFAGWIAGQGRRASSRRLLNEGVQHAADVKDASSRTCCCVRRSTRISGPPSDGEGEIARSALQGIEALEAKSRQIVGKRHGEQAPIDAIAKLVGETPAKTGDAAVPRPRHARRDGRHRRAARQGRPAVLPVWSRTASNGLIVPDAPRELLAGSVLKDLRYSAVFEAQVRSDLLLRATLMAADMEAARALAYALAKPAATRESDRRKPARGSEPRARAVGAIGAASERLPALPATRCTSAAAHRGCWIGVALVALAVIIGAAALNRPSPSPRGAP